jgi:hypothetical protein
MDAERPRDFAYGFALFDQSFGEFSLVFIHLLGATEANAALMCVGTSGTSTLSDEVSLELDDAAEDGHDPEEEEGRWGQGLTAEKMKECVWLLCRMRHSSHNVECRTMPN